MDPVPTLLKAFIDQILKRLPDPADKVRLRVMEDAMRLLVDRSRELEDVATLFADLEAQRDSFLADVIRLRVRVAELEAENRRLKGE